ncbi:uncharacterized protein IUM83_01049 [Phytophthora cinnamomi]|uniref:uncharacterized protein n=1 Tax=Phytophthora cinnamomi TaxID=4785 RepID=UPI00355AA039|nr:hypothetical protein IUM83_01049 [Phytophthora cinnamomi]
MVDSFDVDEFLGEANVSIPVTQCSGGASSAFWMEELNHLPPTGSNTEPAAAIAGGAISEASTDSSMDGACWQLGDTDELSHEYMKKLKKTQRKSRKEEILDLRNSVKHLTDQLEVLKTDPLQHPGSAATTQLWKHAAIRQLGRRRKAEGDNAKLREMLEMQVQEAKCLQRILKRRTKIQMMEDMLGMKRRKKTLMSSVPSDNSQILMRLLRETDDMYARVDSHFAQKEVSDLPCPSQKRNIHRNVIHGVVFEMAQLNRLPFGLRQTEKAAQRVLNELGSSGLKRIEDLDTLVEFHAQESKETRNTIATSYFAVTPSHEYSSGTQVRKVMRMYIEEDSAVFIWKMLAEPKLRGSGASVGYQLQSTLQVVMRSFGTLTVCGDSSTQLLIHFSASRDDLVIPTSAKFCQPGHMDAGFELWEKLVSCIPSEIESLLIDDLCATKGEIRAECV